MRSVIFLVGIELAAVYLKVNHPIEAERRGKALAGFTVLMFIVFFLMDIVELMP